MHPNNYYNLFPAFPRNEIVFVAMSFATEFDHRWADVIVPAVGSIAVDGKRLKAERVDTRCIGDSILTEILTHIRNARLIFGDITSLGQMADRPIRNGNVMYEIGIAHAIRLPEEVLLFRSDADPLLFDVANIRINTYAPDDHPETARKAVVDAVVESLREVDLKKHLAVEAVAHTLDAHSWLALLNAIETGVTTMQPRRSIRQALTNDPHNDAITRLLQLRALDTEYPRLSTEFLQSTGEQRIEEVLSYRITPFGRAVLEFGFEKMGMHDPDVQKAIEALLPEVPT
jgi:hypothetical protein